MRAFSIRRMRYFIKRLVFTGKTLAFAALIFYDNLVRLLAKQKGGCENAQSKKGRRKSAGYAESKC